MREYVFDKDAGLWTMGIRRETGGVRTSRHVGHVEYIIHCLLEVQPLSNQRLRVLTKHTVF